jgi:hypothetical protein
MSNVFTYLTCVVSSVILAKDRFLDPVDHGEIRSILQCGNRLHVEFLDQSNLLLGPTAIPRGRADGPTGGVRE